MSIPPEFLEQLRSRVGIVDVVARRVKLTRKGREHWGCCPFHNEKTGSFSVSDDKGFYHCFGCGAHGDVISFVMRTSHFSFIEAVEKLAEEAGLEMPQATPDDKARDVRRASLMEAMEAACAFYEERLQVLDGKPGLDYLHGRGLSDETITRFRLGFSPRGDLLRRHLLGPKYPEDLLIEAGLQKKRNDGSVGDLFRDRVTFPITDKRGRVIAFGARVLDASEPKYLNSPATPLFDKGSSLYGLAHAREAIGKQDRAVLVEGYLDVITLSQAGMPEAVAPLGTAVTEEQIRLLLKMCARVELLLDGDSAGQKAMDKALWRALSELRPGHEVRFAVLPDKKDPDDLVKESGVEAVEAVLEKSTALVDALWRLIEDKDDPVTPERKAAFERELFRACSQIRDPFVQRHYLSEYRRRLNWGYSAPTSAVLIGQSKKKRAPRPGQLHSAVWDEFVVAAERQKIPEWLAKKNVDWDALIERLGGIGFVRARCVPGKYVQGTEWDGMPRPMLWERTEDADGVGLVLIPEWRGGPQMGWLVDIVGWSPHSGEVYSATGHTTVLGSWIVDLAYGLEAQGLPCSVKVAAGPLSWLQRTAASEGVVCVVDWGRAWDALGCLRELEAENSEVGEALKKFVQPHLLPLPDIFLEGAE